MTFGLTPQGFNKKRLPDEKASEENALIAEFGDINVQPQSIFGQFIGTMSKIIADYWENEEDVYFSQYPNTAEGVSLDYIVALNGITRLPSERTRVIGVAKGFESTLITNGSLARQPNTNENFFVETDSIISRTNAILTLISIDSLADQIYNTLINENSYFYSLPKIKFDSLFVTLNSIKGSINGTELPAVPFNTNSQTTIDDLATAFQALTEISTATAVLGLIINFNTNFVAANSIIATVNGTPLGAVPYNASHAQTLIDLATKIQSDSSVTSCIVTGARQITIVPVAQGTFQTDSIVTTGGASQPIPIDQQINIVPANGFSVTVDFVTTTGGASQPNASTVFATPSTINSIVSAIVAIINNGTDPVTATDILDGTFSLLADDSEVPYSLSLETNMTIQEVSSPIIFLAEKFGVLPAPIDSLTEILTPISGWQTITNLKAGVTGRIIESDAELRLRRQNSIRIIGASTVEAIRARILQEVLGVTNAFIFENRTTTEENLVVVFTNDFITGNQIIFIVNGVSLSTVNFSTNHLTTMQLLEVQLEAVEGISNVTIGGTGNRTLTIEMTQGYEITINSIQITGGASQTDYNISGGRFPKSFEAVVSGGTDEAIANKIWQTKPAGIQTFGNTSFAITDSQNDPQVMNFSRPVPIYIWVKVDLTLNAQETFPTNGINLVKQAIVTYGDSLGIGENVLIQRVACQIFEVSGIASGITKIAFTLNEGDSPSFGSTNITINENEIAIFALTRTNTKVI